ncbi:MAG TPA: AI-2E family transporter [Gemmatimonadales bacterium]|nr:AI-2E family transporter [Gemmatimonadales bacterium]
MSESPLKPEVASLGGPPSGPTGAEPDLEKLGSVLRDRVEVRSVAITGLLVLALFYTLYFAREFFLPILFAVLLDFLLSPIVRLLKRARIPEPIGAAIVLVGLLAVIGTTVYSLAEPTRHWLAKAPETLSHVQDKLRTLRKPVEQVSQTAEQVEKATAVSRGPRAQEVIVRGPSLTERLFGTTQSIATAALEIVILLYFLLAAGDLFLQKLINVLPRFRDKKRAVSIAREVEASVSAYLFMVTLLNVGEGVVVAMAFTLLGVPNPVLWGVLAGLVEFMPYIGATAMTIISLMIGLTTFESLGHALLVPGVYLAINFVQSNFVSPLLLGRRLTLNPVAIFVGLVFWWWIWGVPGAFIAVPLLASFKIFCDHIETLAPIGEFLGR